MAELIVYSPAKVNLYLNVLGLRPDGYHEVQTILSLIDLYDKISLEEGGSDIALSSDNPSIPTDENNLAWRAARILMDYCRLKRGIKIFIEKKIPISAGLGGGSSNAAAVLLGLNRLWKLELAREKLAELGQQLGSDVPFFVWSYPFALATGRGEKITPINCRNKLSFILVNPGIEVSTASIYQQWDRLVSSQIGLTKPHGDVKMIGQKLETGQVEELGPFLYNSLEPVALSMYPVILEMKKVLAGANIMLNLMSGSGPTIFGILKDGKEGNWLEKDILLYGRWWVYLAETLQPKMKGE